MIASFAAFRLLATIATFCVDMIYETMTMMQFYDLSFFSFRFLFSQSPPVSDVYYRSFLSQYRILMAECCLAWGYHDRYGA
jgi:hypothetical protein